MKFIIQYFGNDSFRREFIRKRCVQWDLEFVCNRNLKLPKSTSTINVCVYDACAMNDCGLRGRTFTVNSIDFVQLLSLSSNCRPVDICASSDTFPSVSEPFVVCTTGMTRDAKIRVETLASKYNSIVFTFIFAGFIYENRN